MIVQHGNRSMMFVLVSAVLIGTLMHVSHGTDVNAPNDLFHIGDKDNNSALSIDECGQMWLTLDVDRDETINKIEFLFKWKFANFPDSERAPLFMRLVDLNFDGFISKEEIRKLCLFFDDDEDFSISFQEFQMNWTGMFRSS